MTDEELKQAIAELQEVVRCRCDEAYRDRGLKDPHCECDSAEAVKVVAIRIKALTEQLAAARQDAKAAEDELEMQEQEACMMENDYIKLEKERDALEAKLAKAEAGLLAIAKRDEQMIWGEDYEVEEAFKDMRDIALATLAAVTETHKIKSSKAAPPYGLEGESHE